MLYVKRRNTYHVDSSPDLYGELLSVLDFVLLSVTIPIKLLM